MKAVMCVLLSLTICIIAGCINEQIISAIRDKPGSDDPSDYELRGDHYARLNAIGCYQYDDLQSTRSGDFDIIDKMVREKRCFVLPTDTRIIITERVKGEVVNAKVKGTNQPFYTFRSNLVLP
jgi:hypothetical protein